MVKSITLLDAEVGRAREPDPVTALIKIRQVRLPVEIHPARRNVTNIVDRYIRAAYIGTARRIVLRRHSFTGLYGPVRAGELDDLMARSNRSTSVSSAELHDFARIHKGSDVASVKLVVERVGVFHAHVEDHDFARIDNSTDRAIGCACHQLLVVFRQVRTVGTGSPQ